VCPESYAQGATGTAREGAQGISNEKAVGTTTEMSNFGGGLARYHSSDGVGTVDDNLSPVPCRYL
jgi:hypothetical protein